MITDTTKTERVSSVSSRHTRNLKVRSDHALDAVNIYVMCSDNVILDRLIKNKDLCSATHIHDRLVEFTRQYVAKIEEFLDSETKGSE